MVKTNNLNNLNMSRNSMAISKIGVLIFLIMLVALPLTSASIPSLGVFKIGECINLLQTCADCTYNNISSVTFGNSNGMRALTGPVVMTKAGTEYTTNFCNATVAGSYNVNGYGDPGGVKTGWNYNFVVTPAGGAENNTVFFIIMIIIAVGLVLLGFILNNYIFAFFGGLVFLIGGVYGMIYGYGDITNLYTRMVSYVLIGLGALITLLSSLDLLGSFDRGGSINSEDDD